MSEQYLPILLQAIIVIGFAVTTLTLSWLLGKKGEDNPTKNTPYECGMPTDKNVHARFSIKFYLVAMLFVLFDIEVVFLYPWAVVFTDFLESGVTTLFWSMLSFVGILLLAYLYALRKGALKWTE